MTKIVVAIITFSMSFKKTWAIYSSIFILTFLSANFAIANDLLNTIYPKNKITPYVQWMDNNGYCGEVSAIQAGLNAGLWLSQYNMRLLCGSGLSQSGPDGFCEANGAVPNYNAQMLLESPNPGDAIFSSAPTCLKNAHLKATTFDSKNQASGLEGYKQYITWVKKRVIAGDTVVIGIFIKGEDDPQYDHEVTVTKIETSHSPKDSSYYDDDVIYFDDHWLPFVSYSHGFKVSELANTRDGANLSSASLYSILIPGGLPINSGTGGDGISPNPKTIIPKNYGFAVSGPMDPTKVLLPTEVSILSSGVHGNLNNFLELANYNFESPAIGEEQFNLTCTNKAPTWMDMMLRVEVKNLTIGTSYNIYKYEFDKIEGIGWAASLKIPDAQFNANKNLATQKISFVADAATYAKTFITTSDKIIVFRCVRADAP